MPKIYQKKSVWLLCATIIASHPVFARDAAKPEKNNVPAAVAAVTQKATGFMLDEAIGKALLQSPRLKGFSSGVAAAKGELQQAGVWQNPEINYTNENFGGGAAYKAISPPQSGYGITQLVEIGGKISAREHIAGRGLEIASLDHQAATLDVIRDVTTAYAEAVAAEENVKLATEQKELAEDVLKSVSIRVGAAAAPLIQKSRAEVECSTSTIALDKAIRERDITRKKLAALMGEEHFLLPLDSMDFYAIAKPELAAMEEKLKANPDLHKLNSSLEQAEAWVDLEQANAIPDPRFSVGMIDIPSANDQAFVVGVSLPIPVFNANRGNIEKARSDVNRIELDNRQMVLNISADLTQARERMENAYMQAQTLKTEILPSADKAFQLARTGYGLGRFPYLEVLDAQRSLFGVKQQQIEAIRDFHTAKAQVERLIASHLNIIRTTGETHAK
jgi:cobalt-zinc-cadmium efflux system outer membrane protein